jgi:hypothetical protein
MPTRSQCGAPHLVVVGGGLAGCEAAWQAARRGLEVTLIEMKPARFSPAHASPDLAELVCSNSLRSNVRTNAVGLLKEEMRRLGSLTLAAADEAAVPAGSALAVDRVAFARCITEAVESNPRIRLRRERVMRIPDDERVILATGPLTDSALARDLRNLLGDEYLYFYDALSPIVYADSIDTEVAFRASRYADGDGDYLNLPLSETDYRTFVEALLSAETVPLHPFEASLYFEGCLRRWASSIRAAAGVLTRWSSSARRTSVASSTTSWDSRRSSALVSRSACSGGFRASPRRCSRVMAPSTATPTSMRRRACGRRSRSARGRASSSPVRWPASKATSSRPHSA